MMVTLLIAYYDRLNISLALPLLAGEFHWSDEQVRHHGSLLMGLFFGGYGIANILLSPLGARIGARRSLTIIVCLWSLFTALGAWASQLLTVFMATRVLLGLSEGIHFPTMNSLTKAWFPPHERSRANAVWITGLFLAILTAPLILVPVMHHFGWRSGFYLLALAGMAMGLPLILVVVRDRPAEHPRITEEELDYIERYNRKEEAAGIHDGHYWSILLRPGMLLLTGVGILNNMISLGIAGWLPSYYTRRLGIEYEESAWPVALTQLFSIAGLAVWGVLSDRINRRALIAAIGYAGIAVFLFLALQTNHLWTAVFFFGCTSFCVTAWSSNEFALVQRQIPHSHITQCSGFYNGVTTLIGGRLGPLVTSVILSADQSIVPILALCLLASAILFTVNRILRY